MEGFAGKVAVVTGAGSGIGQALAIELGRSGAKLAISDVDTEGLAVTEERLKAIGAPVKADRLDVTEREAFELYADAVKAHFGKVNQIYNNAGIAFTGDIEVSQFKDIERVMDVDFWGVVNGTKAFLPHLIESGDGHVVNVSSVFGMLLGARPGRLQRRQVRGARIHRGAAPGDDRGRASGEGDMRASRRHQDRRSRATCRPPTASTSRNSRRPSTRSWPDTSPEKAARIILDGRPQEQGPGARRHRRQGPRLHRPRSRVRATSGCSSPR